MYSCVHAWEPSFSQVPSRRKIICVLLCGVSQAQHGLEVCYLPLIIVHRQKLIIRNVKFDHWRPLVKLRVKLHSCVYVVSNRRNLRL